MARTCHSEGMRERRAMRNHSAEGKSDLLWIDDGGRYHHICRYASDVEARKAKERLSEPSDEEQSLIGVPADPTLEIVSR